MSAPTLFKASMNGFIQQESLHSYHQQLAQKKRICLLQKTLIKKLQGW